MSRIFKFLNSSSLFALSQVGNIKEMIAYPDQINNNTYLLEASQALNLTQGQGYFKTVQMAQVIAVTDNLAALAKPINKTK